MRVSTTNLAGTWPLSMGALTLAAGFTTDALFDGHVSLLARTTAFGPGTAEFRFNRGGGAGSATYLIAVFGVRSKALGASNIDSSYVKDSPDGSTLSASLGSFSLDDRGDAWLLVTTTQQYLHLGFHQAASDQLDAGEIWVASKTDFTRDIIGPYDHPESIAAVVNDAKDGTLYADQEADRIDDLTFAWDSLLVAEYQEVRDYFRAVRGAVRSHVVIPDITAADVYLGKLTSTKLPRQVDAPIVRGVQASFRACGHYFYG